MLKSKVATACYCYCRCVLNSCHIVAIFTRVAMSGLVYLTTQPRPVVACVGWESKACKPYVDALRSAFVFREDELHGPVYIDDDEPYVRTRSIL